MKHGNRMGGIPSFYLTPTQVEAHAKEEIGNLVLIFIHLRKGQILGMKAGDGSYRREEGLLDY